jgi:hypothetical protein
VPPGPTPWLPCAITTISWDGFGATLYGDVDPGGAKLDWQALATIDYSFKPWIDVHAGFRIMSFDYNGQRSRQSR